MKYSLLVVLSLLSLYCNSISVKLVPETGNPPTPRKLPGFTYDSIDSKLYIYGGVLDSKMHDMWEFDLTTNRWTELHTVSELRPGPRASPFLLRLQDQRKILLFGGDTAYGPISDLWTYDIDYQTVKFTQWKTLEYSGTPPPRSFYRAICHFTHRNKDFIAVYGGVNKDDYEYSMFL